MPFVLGVRALQCETETPTRDAMGSAKHSIRMEMAELSRGKNSRDRMAPTRKWTWEEHPTSQSEQATTLGFTHDRVSMSFQSTHSWVPGLLRAGM